MTNTYYIIGSYDANEDSWSYLSYEEESGLNITYDILDAESFAIKEEAIDDLNEIYMAVSKGELDIYGLESFCQNTVYILTMVTKITNMERLEIK